MLSIEIDTKSLESVQQHQIVLLCKPYEMELSIMFFIDPVWLFDALLLWSRCMNVSRPQKKTIIAEVQTVVVLRFNLVRSRAARQFRLS